MSPEKPNPSEPTDRSSTASSYEYAASDASVSGSSSGGSDSEDKTSRPTPPTDNQSEQSEQKERSENLPKRPLGLQRSDRSGRLSATGTQPPTFGGLGDGTIRVSGVQADVDQLVRQGLRDLESQRQALQREVEQLERRKSRLEAETRKSFAGASQDIAIRVQGFKDYLVGSLQDLVTAAEEMDLMLPAASENRVSGQPSGRISDQISDRVSGPSSEGSSANAASQDVDMVPLAAQRFAQQRDRINSLLDQYRTRPDYYGPPWQLRRTFEPIHAERTINWFFTQGGRGAVKSMGSRLQNVLVASAAISCLHAIYNQRLCVLVLATTPERLGEWRRWLQDCLGIARADFGTDRGVMLFEASEPMSQRAERLLDSGRVPFLIMDEAEDKVSLALLQYPLWLGFAPDPANPSTDYDYY
jgi:hypothetical protein